MQLTLMRSNDAWFRKQEMLYKLIDSVVLHINDILGELDIDKDTRMSLMDGIVDLNDFWTDLLSMYKQALPVDQVYIHEVDLLNYDPTNYMKKYK